MIRRLWLDASQLVAGGWPVPNATLSTLLSVCCDLKIQICIPEVVAIELEARFGRETSDRRKQAENALGDLNRYVTRVGATELTLTLRSQDEVIGLYRNHVELLCNTHKISIVATPAVPVNDLVRAAATREAPFNEKGEGFRDALIVFTVESTDVAPGPAVLLTSDKDFSGQSTVNRLAPKGVAIERDINKLIDTLQAHLDAQQKAAINADVQRATAALEAARSEIERRIRSIPFTERDLVPQGGARIHTIAGFQIFCPFDNVRVSRADERALISATVGMNAMFVASRDEHFTRPIPVLDGDEIDLDRASMVSLMTGPGTAEPMGNAPFLGTAKKLVQIEARAKYAGEAFADLTIVSVKLLTPVEEVLRILGTS